MIDGEEPCISYPEIMREIRDLGFGGVFSTEWTGFNFIDEPVALDHVRAQQAMV